MAGVAIFGGALELIIDMAIGAGCRCVFTGQRKSGQIMVDCCILPVIGGVALSAVRTKIAQVDVIFSMARVAVRGRTLEHMVDVACSTINCEVLSD